MKKTIPTQTVLVTGGAGFIGSHLVEDLAERGEHVVVIDWAKESWQKQNRKCLERKKNIRFHTLDIRDKKSLLNIVVITKPSRIFHLAAESHVDKSIANPGLFLETNIRGTSVILDVATKYWQGNQRNNDFRFHYCSTDEVYGSIEQGSFHENLPLHPNNPYSASKAAGEHLVTAWSNTRGLPIIVTRSSNNYGTRQGPDKFIPLTIGRCMRRERVLLHGSGQNIRDWIHVRDHTKAIIAAADEGRLGEVYNIGAGPENEKTNQEIVELICDCVDEIREEPVGTSRNLIRFVQDRPGNDRRYSMDTAKLHHDTGWQTTIPFEIGLMETVKWYLENNDYCERNM